MAARRPPPYPVQHVTFSQAASSQLASPLFARLPLEIRSLIFTYALTSYSDPSPDNAYDVNTVYSRPDYRAAHITDIALLSTCQLIYQETWFRAWQNAQHTFYLTAWRRSPLWSDETIRDQKRPYETTRRLEYRGVAGAIENTSEDFLNDYQTQLEVLDDTTSTTTTADVLDEADSDTHSCNETRPQLHPKPFLTFHHARIFPQLYLLEPGPPLADILALPFFQPQTLTITIRHTDWWFWEDDHALLIRSPWLNNVKLPACVKVMRMELESVARKKAQVDYIAMKMIGGRDLDSNDSHKEVSDDSDEGWIFEREDGVLMAPEHNAKSWTWEGSSMLDGNRWVRDEVDALPGKISYYVRTVTWRPVAGADVAAAAANEPQHPHQQQSKQSPSSRPPLLKPQAKTISYPEHLLPKISDEQRPSLPAHELSSALVPAGTSASEARRMVADHVERRRERWRFSRGWGWMGRGQGGGGEGEGGYEDSGNAEVLGFGVF